MKTIERKHLKGSAHAELFFYSQEGDYVHNVYDCVEAFEKLLDKEYRLILGRKGVLAKLNITFDKKECFLYWKAL